MLLSEARDRIVVGMLISRQITKRQIVVGGLLYTPRARLTNRVAVQQQPRQQLGMISSQSSPVFALVAVIDLSQIQVTHNVGDKARQMAFRQPILQARRQQERLIQRTLAESLAHSGISLSSNPTLSTVNVLSISDRLTGCVKNGDKSTYTRQVLL